MLRRSLQYVQKKNLNTKSSHVKKQTYSKSIKVAKLNPNQNNCFSSFSTNQEKYMGYEKLYKRNSVTLANTTKLKYLQIQGRIQMYSYEYLGKVPIPFSMCSYTMVK